MKILAGYQGDRGFRDPALTAGKTVPKTGLANGREIVHQECAHTAQKEVQGRNEDIAAPQGSMADAGSHDPFGAVPRRAGEQSHPIPVQERSIGDSIYNMRHNKVRITAGYDGVYGRIDLLEAGNPPSARKGKAVRNQKGLAEF